MNKMGIHAHNQVDMLIVNQLYNYINNLKSPQCDNKHNVKHPQHHQSDIM